MQDAPLVSAVIPAHNSAATIARALASAVGQEGAALEAVVVDDASSDGTCDVVRAFDSPHVRLLRLEKNAGASAARNAGIEAARGEFVAFLDSDDAWRPGKIARQVERMRANPRAVLATCDSVWVDAAGRVFKRSHVQNPPSSGPAAWKALLANNFIPTPTAFCRRADLLAAGGFDTVLPIAEDLDLWLRLAARGEVEVVPEVLVEIHDRPGSLLKRRRGEEASLQRAVIERHIAAQRPRLSAAEVRRIRGQRAFKLGANFFDAGEYARSVRPFLAAAWHGYRPVKSAVNLPRAIAGALLK